MDSVYPRRVAAGWMDKTFWLSFMAAGLVHGSKDLSREIPIISELI